MNVQVGNEWMHLRILAILEIWSVVSSINTFSTYWWHQCFSIGWKCGAIASRSPLGKSLKMSKSIFFKSFSKWKNNTIHLPTSWDEITFHWDHGRVKGCRILHQLPKLKWEASKNIQKIQKNKFLCSKWIQDMGKWSGRRTATLASWCINRFLYEWGLCSINVYHDKGEYEAHASHNI